MKGNQPASPTWCEVRRCGVKVTRPRVFCSKHWQNISPSIQEQLAAEWPHGSKWLEALKQARVEAEHSRKDET